MAKSGVIVAAPNWRTISGLLDCCEKMDDIEYTLSNISYDISDIKATRKVNAAVNYVSKAHDFIRQVIELERTKR